METFFFFLIGVFYRNFLMEYDRKTNINNKCELSRTKMRKIKLEGLK